MIPRRNPKRPFPRPIVGRDAVVAFNETIWRDVYPPECDVEILDEVGDEEWSAVRFVYRAHLVGAGVDDENEYTLFAWSGPGGIVEVFEGLDTAALLDTLSGRPIGTSFRQLGSATE